jgi:hypothetical protein
MKGCGGKMYGLVVVCGTLRWTKIPGLSPVSGTVLQECGRVDSRAWTQGIVSGEMSIAAMRQDVHRPFKFKGRTPFQNYDVHVPVNSLIQSFRPIRHRSKSSSHQQRPRSCAASRTCNPHKASKPPGPPTSLPALHEQAPMLAFTPYAVPPRPGKPLTATPRSGPVHYRCRDVARAVMMMKV